MVHMSAKEYREMNQKKPKGSKHHNHFVYVYEDGFTAGEKDLAGHGPVIRKYDSRKEYARHRELELLERGGAISGLRWQVPMLIFDGFTDGDRKKVRPIYYKADFTYIQGGKEVVEDVKAIDRDTGRPLVTEAFSLKWKMLRARYPDKVFRIF
ncbi:DUF1064 domain-containing protein [uncultured Flavonifractor sp.]|uniref:DUF1064 domain-containing protein n=1 Tax=uncultured Flavonifractor sp. TaxID=1193534 RepID=UPI0025974ACC|nr:DUF1064 domain-containing protein [uncultured Flavonifractor sp.]